ncbi:MAG: hypothetical protein QOI15_1106 [Pseudonocardiales bacterium]|jgi:hypothetical protein|nr:hypothetical protein [Pseudonocardiales bacterium]
MNDRYDDAELRLRAADPAGPSRPLPPSRVTRAELIEEIMTTTDEAPATPTPSAKPSRTRWLLAAAAVAAIAVAGTLVAVNVGSDSKPTAAPQKTVKHLALPTVGGPATQMCIRFEADHLRDMPVAFSGTVAEATDTDVLIDVDHWYKGGSADQVQLANHNQPEVALEGGIQFEVGHRYLVSASDGTVSMCGYSGEWSAEFEQSFQEAFGS